MGNRDPFEKEYTMSYINKATPEDWDALRTLAGDIHPKEEQVGGSHYKDQKHQPLEVCLDRHGFEAFRGACLVKIDKYLARNKGRRLEDYKKARHILQWLIVEQEREDDKV